MTNMINHQTILSGLSSKIDNLQRVMKAYNPEHNRSEAEKISFLKHVTTLYQELEQCINECLNNYRKGKHPAANQDEGQKASKDFKKQLESHARSTLEICNSVREIAYAVEGKHCFAIKTFKDCLRWNSGIISWYGTANRSYTVQRLLWLLNDKRSGKPFQPTTRKLEDMEDRLPEQYKWIASPAGAPTLEHLALFKILRDLGLVEASLDLYDNRMKAMLEEKQLFEELGSSAGFVTKVTTPADPVDVRGKCCPICWIDFDATSAQQAVLTRCRHAVCHSCLHDRICLNTPDSTYYRTCPHCNLPLYSSGLHVWRLVQRQRGFIEKSFHDLDAEIDEMLLSLTWDHVKDVKCLGREMADLLDKLEEIKAEHFRRTRTVCMAYDEAVREKRMEEYFR